MKNKNGFTLIELLAIIVILGIIALITVPIISDAMEKSRKDAAKDSTYGYVDAVNRLYYSKSLNNEDDVEDGIYTVSQLKTVGVSVNGSEPSDGWVELENNEVVAYSIKIGKYVITKYRDSELVCEKGDVQPDESTSKKMKISEKVDTYVKAALTANSSITGETAKNVSRMSNVTTNPADSGWIHFNKINNSVVVVDYSLTYGDLTANYSSLTNGNYVSTFGEERNKPLLATVGSDVCLTETDCFKVIEINGETATLLANNNINPETGMQGENGRYYTVAFSQTNYWISNNMLVSKYSNNGAYTYDASNDRFIDANNTRVYPDIYDSTKNDTSGTNYSVAYYVNQYVENLQNLGINVMSGRILTKSEVESGGIAYSYRSSGKNYWLGSANGSGLVYYWAGSVNYGTSYSAPNAFGVRPVIYIGTSDI